jgi:hypothetical protein
MILLNNDVDFRGRHSPDTAGRAVSLLDALRLRGPLTTWKGTVHCLILKTTNFTKTAIIHNTA